MEFAIIDAVLLRASINRDHTVPVPPSIQSVQNITELLVMTILNHSICLIQNHKLKIAMIAQMSITLQLRITCYNYLQINFLRILDSKHFTGIKFCILFRAQSNLLIAL